MKAWHHSRLVHRSRLLLIAAATLLAAAPSAHAGQGYEASFAGQSDNLTLESGETAGSFFLADNIGTATWNRVNVRLGTAHPRDRSSALVDSSWIQPNRATSLTEVSVPPGSRGRFDFTVRAPLVSATTVFREAFAPVAETIDWMESPSWPYVYLDYAVIPPADPTVAITAAPDQVQRGTPVEVTANASDNRRIARVEFSLAGAKPEIDTQAPYAAALATDGLPNAAATLEVRAVDGVGRSSTVTRPVVIEGAPNGSGASRAAVLSAGFGPRAKAIRTLRFGRSALVRGRLTATSGAPIAGATVQVDTRIRRPGAGFRPLATATTRPDGRFAVRVRRGPSRDVRLHYVAFSGDPAASAVRGLRLETRAGVRISASRKRVRLGGRVRFTARLRGGPYPSGRAVVVLQGYQRGFGWRPVRVMRGRRDRYAATYRFQRVRTMLRLRAYVGRQDGYPYATGKSRSVAVRVR